MLVEIVHETHFTSVDNERGIATGWLDGELSEVGRRQAEELGLRRRDDRLAAVYVSDLRRAVDSAAIAFAGTGVPIHRDRRLRECDYGDLNGMRSRAWTPSARAASTSPTRAGRAIGTSSSGSAPSWTTWLRSTRASVSSPSAMRRRAGRSTIS